MQDTYKEIMVFEYPNMVATVHIPSLSEEERDKRMRVIQQAAINLLKERK